MTLVPPMFERPGWYDRARCSGVGPEMFYVERGGSTAQAVAICQGCEVRRECMHFALQRGEAFGIWGGLSQRQLGQMRSRRIAPRAPRKGDPMNDQQVTP